MSLSLLVESVDTPTTAQYNTEYKGIQGMRFEMRYNHLGNGRMVDAHIRRMRAKLGTAQEMIRTVRGVGYCFKPIE